MKKKLISLLLVISLVFTAIPCFVMVASAANGVTYADGQISFVRDFTTAEKYDMTWQQDEAVYETSGNLVVTPNSIRALGCGKQNSSSSGSGYVSYLIEAPEGCTIETLNYAATGRAYHSTSNAECSAGNCACGYEVSVSVDGGTTYTKVSTEEIVTSGSTKNFSYDLSSIAAGANSAIVKLYMSGKSWDWVHMQTISITGTYVSGEIAVEGKVVYDEESSSLSMTRDFTKLDKYSTAFTSDDAVYESGGNLVITPNSIRALGCGKQNSSSTGAGYLTYLISAPEGNVLDTLSYTATGRTYHSTSNADCEAGNCVCGYEVSVSVDGGATYTKVSTEEIVTSGSTKDFSYDLSEAVKGCESALIKVYLSGKNWDWVHMQKISVTGTYAEKKEEVQIPEGEFVFDDGTFKLVKDFTDCTAYDMSFVNDKGVYESYGYITVKDPAQGLGSGRQNMSSTGSGYISYLLNVPEGNVVDTLHFTAHGRAYHSTSNSECKAGTCSCEFQVYVSTDGGATYVNATNYDITTGKSSWGQEYSFDISEAAKGAEQVIVKIAISGKSWNWISFTDYEISGTYKEYAQEYTYDDEYDYRFKADYSQLATYDTSWQNDAYAFDFMERGPENPVLGAGKKDVSSDGTGYVVYKFDAPEGKLISDMQVYIDGRAFHYTGNEECGSGECNCGLKIYVSQDGENYTLAGTEAPGLSGTFGVGFYHNVSQYARNAKTAYVKIEITTKSWDWISMSFLEVYGNYKDANVGISGDVSVSCDHNNLAVGDSLSVNVDVANAGGESFAGHIELVYPSYYLEVATAKQSVQIAAGGSSKYIFDAKALEGGFGNVFVCLYDDEGKLLDAVELIVYVGGKGVYLGDPHNQSFESDGRNSFLDNFTQLVEKGFSFVITADHNALDPWDKTAQDAAVAELKKTYTGEFVALKGAEVTTAGNAHVLCYNYATNYEVLQDTQWIIDEVINQGGLTFLAHPFIGENYYFNGIENDQTATDVYKNFTGVEIYNGETSWVHPQDGEYNFMNLEFWDRMNLTGQKKFFGTAGSDSHDSIIIGTVGDAFLADSLSEEDLMKAFATGKFYVTNGPSIRMSIGEATFGQTYEVNTVYDNLAELSINVYDPDYPITKVVLYKYTIGGDIDAAYEKGQAEALVLYERAGDTIYSFDYTGEISVKAGEFYRLAAYTVRGSHNWPCENDYGLAYGNPIWVGKQIKEVTLSAKPTKLTYEEGDVLDLEGMKLTVTYYDGSTADVMGWYAYGFDSSEVGTSTVNVLYEGHVNSFDVTVKEKQGVVKAEDGKISFFRDFTGFEAFAEGWKNDPAVEGVSGNICIQTPDKGLGSGKQNVSSTGAGYIDYRVSVPEGNVITALSLIAHGRAYHSSSNSECSAGNCACAFTVSVSTNGGITFKEVYDHDFSTATSSFGQEYVINMDEAVQNYDTVIVRVYLSGKSWNWVSFTDFAMTGTYEEGVAIPQPAKGSIWYENGKITWDKDFTVLPEYDMSWAEDGAVYETNGMLTVSPSTNRTLGVGKRNTSSTGEGYVSYIVDVPEGNILDTLTFTAHGRAYHSSSSEDCKNGTCTCAFKVYISVDGGKIYKEVYDHEFNHSDSTFDNEFTVDFADYIKDKKTAIIKVYMSGRSWNWVGFTDFSIRGTYKEGIYIPDVIVEDGISVQYDQIAIGNDEQWQKDAYAYENLVIGSGDRPWLSVYPANGSWEGVTGSVVYKVVSDVGKFEEFTVSGIARVFSFENSPAAFRIYYSTDGETYYLFKDYPSTTNGEELTYFNESLMDHIGDTDVVYVKIEMESGYWDWVCLKELTINGVSKTTHINVSVHDGESVIYNNSEFYANTALNAEFTKEGYVFDGLFRNAELTEAYNGERITENTILYAKWTLIEYNVIYNGADLENGKYSIESSLVLPVPEKEGYTFEGWYLTEVLDGEAVTEIAAGIGDVQVYAKWSLNEYDVIYNGAELENGKYSIESSLVLPVPEKEGYTFEGWYLTEALDGEAVTEIAAGVGDVQVYAKWTLIEYDVIYNGAELENGKYSIESGLVLPTPEKDGYIFEGWYLTEDFDGEKVTEIVAGTGDIWLYAKWQAVPVEDEDPESEKPEDEKPEDEKPEDEKPEDEKPEDEKPEDEKPEDEKPEDEKPEDEKPEDEKPEGEKPEDEKPEGEKPEDEKPEDEKTEDEENPKTGDNLWVSVVAMLSSVAALPAFKRRNRK